MEKKSLLEVKPVVVILMLTILVLARGVNVASSTVEHKSDMNLRQVPCRSAYDCRLTGCRAPMCDHGYCTCPAHFSQD
ncbi:unnamed protein product [Amaranthus hypochondriacus]